MKEYKIEAYSQIFRTEIKRRAEIFYLYNAAVYMRSYLARGTF